MNEFSQAGKKCCGLTTTERCGECLGHSVLTSHEWWQRSPSTNIIWALLPALICWIQAVRFLLVAGCEAQGKCLDVRLLPIPGVACGYCIDSCRCLFIFAQIKTMVMLIFTLCQRLWLGRQIKCAATFLKKAFYRWKTGHGLSTWAPRIASH